MSGEYEHPDGASGTGPCAYTSYEHERDEDVECNEKGSTEGAVPATGAGAEGLERRVWEALYGVQDPEMPISVVDLGLVYGVEIDEEESTASVEMTLTYTGCPAREMLLTEVERSVAAIDGVKHAGVTLVWSPAWTVDMVTERGKESLREFGLSV